MTSLKYELRGFDGIILDEDMWMYWKVNIYLEFG